MARPSTYTDALGISICAQIASGKSLVSICNKDGMPSVETVYYWLRDETKKEFLNTYTRAREDQADTLADEIIDIADNSENDVKLDKDGNERIDSEVVARSRLRVEARKWVAAKLKPKKYGDKVDITANVTINPIAELLAQVNGSQLINDD